MAKNIDFTKLATTAGGAAAGGGAAGMVYGFMPKDMPVKTKALIPIGIGLALIYVGEKNELLKMAGAGMIAVGADRFISSLNLNTGSTASRLAPVEVQGVDMSYETRPLDLSKQLAQELIADYSVNGTDASDFMVSGTDASDFMVSGI